MIVLLDNVIHSYEDPVLLFCHYAMFVSRQIKSFHLLSVETQTIEQFLTSFHYNGDYLTGKLGPRSLRNLIWKNKRYGPAFGANNERVMSIISNENKLFKNFGCYLDSPIIPVLNNRIDSVTFLKIWQVLLNAEQHFKLPHELTVDPIKSLSRVLRSALKYCQSSDTLRNTNFQWVFQYFIMSERQKDDIQKLLDSLVEHKIYLPMISILMVIARFQQTILNFKASKFLKESIPVSDFARFCILVRHHIFSKVKNSRKDLVLFWNSVWNEWSKLSDDERKRRMIGSSGVYRGWADQDELKLFIPTSEDSDSDTDWFSNTNTSKFGLSQESGLELIQECDGECLGTIDTVHSTHQIRKGHSFDSNTDNISQNISANSNAYLAGIENFNCANCISSQLDRTDVTSISSSNNVKNNEDIIRSKKEVLDQLPATHVSINDYIPISTPLATHEDGDIGYDVLNCTRTELSKESSFHEKENTRIIGETVPSINSLVEKEMNQSSGFNPHLVLLSNHSEDERIISPNNYNTLNVEETFLNTDSMSSAADLESLRYPGVLTAILDEPSSVTSSAFNSDVEDLRTQLHSINMCDETIPEKIQMFEKLSGSSSKPKTYKHGSILDVESTKESGSGSLKTTLKPIVKRPTSSKVMKLKEFIETQPELITLKSVQNFETNTKESRRNGFVKKGKSISEIFSALLDDNMRDLSVSAEYRNKIVRPQDLYNRIKIDTDKPWNLLSKKTKQKYYDAFLRKYDTVLNEPESLTLDIVDLLEIVKVCVDFEDVHHKVVQYAVNLVESEEFERSDTDEYANNSLLSLKSINRESIVSLQNFRRSPLSMSSSSADSVRSWSPR